MPSLSVTKRRVLVQRVRRANCRIYAKGAATAASGHAWCVVSLIFRPTVLINRAFLTMESATTLRKSAGSRTAISVASNAIAFLTSGAVMVFATAAPSLSMTAWAYPSVPRNPSSRCNRCLAEFPRLARCRRADPSVCSGCDRPPRTCLAETCCIAAGAGISEHCDSPATSEAIEGPPPLYGTCKVGILVSWTKYAPVRGLCEPTPADAMLNGCLPLHR